MADLSEYRVLDGIEFSPDVKKLMSLFAECWEECYADDCTTCKYRHGRDHYKLMYCLSERYAEKLIAKAADVAPVRHGRWEWLGPNRLVTDCMCGTCSACKVRSKYIVNTMLCPNCGAKMDGGADR